MSPTLGTGCSAIVLGLDCCFAAMGHGYFQYMTRVHKPILRGKRTGGQAVAGCL